MHRISLDSIFKNAGEITSEIAQSQAAPRRILRFLLIVLVCGSIYGATMGIAHSWQQALSSALKVPMLYLLTLLICIPTLHFIGLFLGSRITFTQSLSVLLFGISANAALLLSFSTISLFFFITGSSYRFLLLMHVVVFMISGAAGLISIRRSFRQLSAEAGLPAPGKFSLLQIWMLLYMFVGTQMAFVLGPFVGKEPEFYWFHHGRGNFYSYVLHTIYDRYSERLEPDKASELVSEPAALALNAIKHRDYVRLSQIVHPTRGVRFIQYSIPAGTYSAELDPHFTAEALAETARSDASVLVYKNYMSDSNETETRSMRFSELHGRMYDADFMSSVENAHFNEFTRGRQNKDRLYAAFPGAIFVEFTASKDTETWKALRLVFAPINGSGGSEDWRLVAVIHDQSPVR